MTEATVEVRLRLANSTFHQLQQIARKRGATKEAVVTQALDLLSRLEESSVLDDYRFSVAAMRPDWAVMPDDWMADEVMNALSTR